MKKILMFLIISTVFICSSAEAEQCGNEIDTALYLSSLQNFANSSCSENLGTFDSKVNAKAAVLARGPGVITSTVQWDGGGCVIYVATGFEICDDENYASIDPKACYALYVTGTCEPVTAPDADGDGIPDDVDAYPNDAGSYQFQIMMNIYDADGNCVGQIIHTSNGDYYMTGGLDLADVQAGLSDGTYTADYVNGSWQDSSDLSNDTDNDIITGGGTSPVTGSEYDGIEQPAIVSDIENDVDDIITGGGTGTQGGSSGGTTDSENLGDIAGNTDAIADNQEITSAYAAVQAALQKKTNNLIAAQTAADKAYRSKLEKEAEQGKSAFTNTDVSAHYNSTNFSGELIEGTDYETPGELSEESWFTSFFTSNPLKTAFDNSGFNLSSATCDMEFTIPSMGTFELSLCEFASEFQMAGTLLLSLTGLASLIMIVRG